MVKVEQPPHGDRIRFVPPYGADGESPQHMSMGWGKRSIALDARNPEDLKTILDLAERADVIVENQLAGFWKSAGINFEAMRAARPGLIVCSVTGFGQTGPWAKLPSHGLNMDALGDTLNVDWEDGKPHRGWAFTSWGNELGTLFAATAICAALVSVRSGGEGAWIDLSCWDSLVECHRVEIAMTTSTGKPFSLHTAPRQTMYTTYLSKDGLPVLLGTLEPKFWKRFCERIGREDLIGRHSGESLAFGDDDTALHAELEGGVRQGDGERVARTLRRLGCPRRPGAGRASHHDDRPLQSARHRAGRGDGLAECGDFDSLAPCRCTGGGRSDATAVLRRAPPGGSRRVARARRPL